MASKFLWQINLYGTLDWNDLIRALRTDRNMNHSSKHGKSSVAVNNLSETRNSTETSLINKAAVDSSTVNINSPPQINLSEAHGISRSASTNFYQAVRSYGNQHARYTYNYGWDWIFSRTGTLSWKKWKAKICKYRPVDEKLIKQLHWDTSPCNVRTYKSSPDRVIKWISQSTCRDWHTCAEWSSLWCVTTHRLPLICDLVDKTDLDLNETL
jgi:hypothetical protein